MRALPGVVPRMIALLIPLLGSSCLSISWERKLHEVRLEPARYAGLEPGVADLQTCLRQLGAPLTVWELPAGRFAIAYGWDENRELGLSVSVPVTQRQSANFDYDEINLHRPGVVFFFDSALVLESRREGRLNNLREETRRRPDSLEE